MAKSRAERDETKYIRELKKQIERLNRENAQLRKTKNQLEHHISDLDEESSEKPSNNTRKTSKKPCPSCGNYEIIELHLRGLQYYKCNSCLSKGKLNERMV